MSERMNFEIMIYSPRWGHEDAYEINVSRNEMIVKGKGHEQAICSWVENRDPVWTGYNEAIGNPLQNILENEKIYPPTVFTRALESAWRAWRDNTLADEQLNSEVQVLCEWINVVTRNMPKTDFWRKIF